MIELLKTNAIIVDRPKDSSHPRYGEATYQLDYDFLENTASSDGGGIDMWYGSLISVRKAEVVETLTGILCTFDTLTKYCIKVSALTSSFE